MERSRNTAAAAFAAILSLVGCGDEQPLDPPATSAGAGGASSTSAQATAQSSAATGGQASGAGGGATSSGSGGFAGGGFAVDHTSIALFEQIPDAYLEAARQTPMVFSDRSVGQNINEALDCLTASSWASAPSSCRRDYVDAEWSWKTFTQTDMDNMAVPARITFAPDPMVYDRQNWIFEFRSGSWSELTQDFVEQLAPQYLGQAEVLSYQFSYLNVADGDDIADPNTGFFANNPNKYDVHDLEAFIAQHPDEVFVFWTTSLARAIGTQVASEFNATMRSYAQQNGKILFDVADIESHTDTGQPCYDNRDGVAYCIHGTTNCENHPDDGMQLPAICQDYTTEINGGHLGSVSGAKIRIAKAFWVLMARIAGWQP